MNQDPRPVVVVSRCLELAACRWNGVSVACPFVRSLQAHADLRPVCPEVELGLGVPREPVRLLLRDGGRRLVQPATGRDLTEAMDRFARTYLDGLSEVDGFLLKSRSPSCGIKEAKLYRGPERGAYVEGKVSGAFAAAVLERFPGHAIEDEGRMLNFRAREHFLVRIFAFARFRRARASGRMAELVRFQADNKLLLMAHSQKHMRELGRAVANHERLPFDAVAARCETVLRAALARPSRPSNEVNVLLHAQGFFGRTLAAREKRYFESALQQFRDGHLPLSAVAGIVHAHAVRFEIPWLLSQTFFRPYPEALVDLADSGKGREL